MSPNLVSPGRAVEMITDFPASVMIAVVGEMCVLFYFSHAVRDKIVVLHFMCISQLKVITDLFAIFMALRDVLSDFSCKLLLSANPLRHRCDEMKFTRYRVLLVSLSPSLFLFLDNRRISLGFSMTGFCFTVLNSNLLLIFTGIGVD